MRDVKEPEIRRAEIMDAAMILFMEKGYNPDFDSIYSKKAL